MRTNIKFGFPLEGYENLNDRYDEQIETVFKFMKFVQTLVDQSTSDEV